MSVINIQLGGEEVELKPMAFSQDEKMGYFATF